MRTKESVTIAEAEVMLSPLCKSLLKENSLEYTGMIQPSSYHFAANRMIAGVNVVLCADAETGILKVVRLSDQLIPQYLLHREAKLVQSVNDSGFLSDTGWEMEFSKMLQFIRSKRSVGLVFPYYTGDLERKWANQYNDEEVTNVGTTLLEGMLVMPRQLKPQQQKLLRNHYPWVRELHLGTRLYSLMALKLRGAELGIFSTDICEALWSIQKREIEVGCRYPERIVHYDLNVFNVVPNPESHRITVIDLATLSIGQSLEDFGRILISLLCVDRKGAMISLEKNLSQKGLITPEELRVVKAGALIDQGRKLLKIKAGNAVERAKLERQKNYG